MTTQSYTFETIQELNDKKAELIAAYGSENIVPNYGTFEKGNYNVNFNIFSVGCNPISLYFL